MPAPLHFLLYGSVPLFTAFGIRVRAHASLLLIAALFLIFGIDKLPWQFNFEGVGILIAIILLHEFGHCIAARMVGGEADDILLTPLGGLASAMSPHRPGATFVTIAGGPAVNVIICVGCAAGLTVLGHAPSWNPWHPAWYAWGTAAFHLNAVFTISYFLLLFNLLPIYALDGGQMLHTILWPSSRA
jgi:Zn-dependent protease